MREYLYAPDVVRVIVVAGVIVSILFYERMQLTTGGAIVPSYLALAVPAPVFVITTLVSGYLSWVIVHVLLPRRKILYGRRKFEVEVLVGLGFVMAGTLIAMRVGDFHPVLFGLTGIGFLLPGIICHDMGRQGPRKTLWAIGATTAIVAALAYLYATILRLVAADPADARLVLAGLIGYPRELIVVAATMSILVGMVIFAKLGVRSGGFISGAYIALVAPRWPDILFALGCAVVTWVIVVKGLMPRLLLFGRRKLATMILVSSVVTWSAELVAIALTNEQWIPWRGLTVVTLMVPALVANDAQRQGWEKTLWGVALCGLGVFGAMGIVTAVAMWLGFLS